MCSQGVEVWLNGILVTVPIGVANTQSDGSDTGVGVSVNGMIVTAPITVVNTLPDDCDTEGTYDVNYRCDYDIVCECCCCKAEAPYKVTSYATARRVVSGANTDCKL